MFHFSLKPWNALKRPLFQSLEKEIKYHPGCLNKLTYSTLSVPEIRSQLATTPPSAFNEIWDKAIEQYPLAAVEIRNVFYEKMRELGLGKPDFSWSIAILNALTRDQARYSDYLFAMELLVSQKDWETLESFITSLALSMPTFWERITEEALVKGCPDIPLYKCLSIIGESCVNQGIDLGIINRDTHFPVVKMLQLIISSYDASLLISSLEEIAETNIILANTLSSAILRALSDALIDSEIPPNPLNGHLSRSKNDTKPELADLVWQWKAKRDITQSEDLRVYMMYLVYKRKSHLALSVYDDNPMIHNFPDLNEALLLAATGTGDYTRLQVVFEQVEKNPDMIRRLGSRRYSIVLGALGYLGDVRVLDSIYENLRETQPNLISRGVYHALIHSHAVRGDLLKARKVYDTMVNSGIEPTYTTFNLILQAYRDAMDLKAALMFIGDEMINKHQLALRNQELSLLLSLCGKRRDHISANYVWKWGTSLVHPDRLSWNTRLYVLVSANMFPDARIVFNEMEEKGLISIDTLTIMLSAAGRSRNLVAYTSELLEKKKKLDLIGDDGWYLALLSAVAEWGDVSQFEHYIEEMKAVGVKLHSSHYALYTELIAKTKQFHKHERITQEMKENHIPLNFAYIEKQFRLLECPGSSQEARQSAHLAAINLIKKGYFDPKASMVPRGAIPVRVIEPTVRRLTKSGQFIAAKDLLDSLRKQRVNEPVLHDEHMIWSLYMEIADASKNYYVIGKLWNEFTRTLSLTYVLDKPSLASRELASNENSKPVFKVAKRYRFVFCNAIDIRIRYLQLHSDRKNLLELPESLEQMGLVMNGKNNNTYIVALVSLGEAERAFEVALTARRRAKFNLSTGAKESLSSVVHRVNYKDYGSLGQFINELAKRFGS